MQKIHLQFYGDQHAVAVENLTAGMVTVWNGGVKKAINGVKASKSGKTFQIIYADGSLDSRKMRAGRLVAIA